MYISHRRSSLPLVRNSLSGGTLPSVVSTITPPDAAAFADAPAPGVAFSCFSVLGGNEMAAEIRTPVPSAAVAADFIVLVGLVVLRLRLFTNSFFFSLFYFGSLLLHMSIPPVITQSGIALSPWCALAFLRCKFFPPLFRFQFAPNSKETRSMPV